jgi:signal peptidase II
MAATSRPARVRLRALAKAALVAAVVVGVDQLTKHTIGTSIAPGHRETLIPGVLHLVYVRNTGVAFSALAGSGDLVYLLVAVAVAALLVLLWLRPERRLLWLPVGMLLGGAIGNVIDRLVLGSVIDFIKLPDWPAFNLADTSITLGVILLVLLLEFGGPRGEERR